MSDEEYNYMITLLSQITERINSIEAYQRNAESGTTARSADRVPCSIEEFLAELEGGLDNAKRLHEADDLVYGNDRIKQYQFAIKRTRNFIEARRRSTGCA